MIILTLAVTIPKIVNLFQRQKKKNTEKLATLLVCFFFQVDCHRADPELLQGSLVKKATILQLTGGA